MSELMMDTTEFETNENRSPASSSTDEEQVDTEEQLNKRIQEEAEQFLTKAIAASAAFGIDLKVNKTQTNENVTTEDEVSTISAPLLTVPSPPRETKRANGNKKSNTSPTKTSDSMKAELQARLRKRIENKEQPTGNEDNGENSPTEYKKSAVYTRSAAGTYTPKKVYDPADITETKTANTVGDSPVLQTIKKRQRRKSEAQELANSEVVEGFEIIASDVPNEENNNNNETKINDKDHSHLFGGKRVGKGTAKLRTSSGAAFGPNVLKMAIKDMGGRATGNQITDWVIEKSPHFLELFGDKKKLRYSIIGILSAKSYGTIFGKEVIVRNGTKRKEWFVTAKGLAQNYEEDDKYQDDSGLFLLSHAIQQQETDLPKNKNSKRKNTSNANKNNNNNSNNDINEEMNNDNQQLQQQQQPQSLYDFKYCSVCNLGDNDDQLLLCDYCDNGFHTYCLVPVLETIPEGTWYCTTCKEYLEAHPDEIPPNQLVNNPILASLNINSNITNIKTGSNNNNDNNDNDNNKNNGNTFKEEEEYIEKDNKDTIATTTMKNKNSKEEENQDNNNNNNNKNRKETSEEEYILLNTRACDKHRRWKKKCPPDCPNRLKLMSNNLFGNVNNINNGQQQQQQVRMYRKQIKVNNVKQKKNKNLRTTKKNKYSEYDEELEDEQLTEEADEYEDEDDDEDTLLNNIPIKNKNNDLSEDDVEEDYLENDTFIKRRKIDEMKNDNNSNIDDTNNNEEIDYNAPITGETTSNNSNNNNGNNSNMGGINSINRRSGGTPTYIEMIEEAIQQIGGQASTPAITNYMEEKHGTLLSTKTKTWRNSVSGCLSTHFQRADSKDNNGRTLWTIRKDKAEVEKIKRRYYHSEYAAKERDNKIDKEDRRSQRIASTKNKNNNNDDSNEEVEYTKKTYKKRNKGNTSYPTTYLENNQQGTIINNSNTSNVVSSSGSNAVNATGAKYKVPGRSTVKPKKIFEVDHFNKIKETNKWENSDYWNNYKGIEFINRAHPLDIIDVKLEHNGPVYAMNWSTDFTMLASVDTSATIRIWDVSDWKLLIEIKDKTEQQIEELYDVVWIEKDELIMTSGRIKDRSQWNDDLNDNPVIQGTIKIYNVLSTSLLISLSGHNDDVLSIKPIKFNNNNYIISCGNDGTIIKHHMNNTWSERINTTTISTSGSGIAVYLEFLPNCGNKFYAVGFSSGIRIYDNENDQLIQTFPNLYSYLCDCVRFIPLKEIPTKPNEFYMLTKGVELLDENDNLVKPNACHLRKLTLPENGVGNIQLEEINSFQHSEYQSNVWLMKLNSNGRYVLSPTTDGRVFVWNVRTKEIVAILNDHGKFELRDILFHPTKKLLLTAGDDSTIRIYSQKENETNEEQTNTPKEDDTDTQATQQAKEEVNVNKDTENMDVSDGAKKVKGEDEEEIDITSVDDDDNKPKKRKQEKVEKMEKEETSPNEEDTKDQEQPDKKKGKV